MMYQKQRKTLESSCKARANFGDNMRSSGEYFYIQCYRIIHGIYSEYGLICINNIFHLVFALNPIHPQGKLNYTGHLASQKSSVDQSELENL